MFAVRYRRSTNKLQGGGAAGGGGGGGAEAGGGGGAGAGAGAGEEGEGEAAAGVGAAGAAAAAAAAGRGGAAAMKQNRLVTNDATYETLAGPAAGAVVDSEVHPPSYDIAIKETVV
jgi:hypothetical protein